MADEDGRADDDSSIPDAVSGKLGVVRNTEAKTKSPSLSASSAWVVPTPRTRLHRILRTSAPFRPFENLPPMPADLSEAFELFKLAILSHKLSAWQDIALDDVLVVLDSLKHLALAPAE